MGSVVETSTPGTYVCPITYTIANLPLGTQPWVHWSVNGAPIDDPSPINLNGPLDIITGDGGYNMRQMIQIILAAVSAKLSGLPSGPAVIKDASGNNNRISVTFDANNNRIAVTYTPPG